MNKHHHPARQGFTMIEAIMVISLVIILTSITVPGSISALKDGRVNQAVSKLETLNSDAQRFARAAISNASGDYYGVRIEGGAPPHRISLVFGNSGSAPAVEGLTRVLNPNVLFYQGDNVLTSNVTWFYQYGTGFPVSAQNLLGANVAIGTASSTVISDLSLRSTDGSRQIRCEIFEVGLFNREKIQ